MKNEDISLLNELEKLHHPQMTSPEQNLKSFYLQRTDLRDKILSGNEMSEYILWMIDQNKQRASNPSPSDLPDILSGGEIQQITKNLLEHPGHPSNRKALAGLYEISEEANFFRESQDISCGRILRYFPPYRRTDVYFEIYYAFSGCCPFYFENESLTLSPGNVLLVPPGIEKAFSCPDDDCTLFFYMIRKSTFRQVFWSHLSDRNLMSNFFHNALSAGGSTTYLGFETGQDLWIELTLYRIFKEYHANAKYSSRLINALMSGFFLSLLQQYEGTARVSESSSIYWKPQFAEILRYIQDNYSTVTLAELATRFNYSDRQLIRIIKSCTGQSFSQLQTKLRMEQAARLLRVRDLSSETIATELGFSGLSSFHRAFVRYYGCTPGEYKTNKADK